MPQLFVVDCGGGDLLLDGTRSGARELPSVEGSNAHFASSAVRELPIPPVCHTLGCGQGYCSRRESGGLEGKAGPVSAPYPVRPLEDHVAPLPSAVFRRFACSPRLSASAVSFWLSDHVRCRR